MSELKPCPFCGRTEGGLFVDTDEIGWHYVWCAPSDGGCGATGPGGVDDDHAIERWNSRAERKVDASDAVAPTDTPTDTPTVPAERSET